MPGKKPPNGTLMETTMIRKGPGRPSAAGAEGKQRALINAALEEFVRAGFHGASLRDIAAKAEISTRTLYNRFADKLALFEACLEFMSRQMAPVASPESNDLGERLCGYAVSMHQQLSSERSRQIAQLIFRESTEFEELRRLARMQFERYQVEPVACILRDAGFAEGLCHELATQFVVMALGEWQRRLLFGGAQLSETEVRRNAKIVSSIFLGGAKSCQGIEE